MKNRIKNDVKEQFLNSLQTIISYPSVLNEGENGTPFGQAIQDVLEKTLELARELGICRDRSGGRTPGRSLSLGCCSSR